MQSAVEASLPDLRGWMRTKASLHGHGDRGLPWWDLVAPLPTATGSISWDDGLDVVRHAFSDYSSTLGGLVDRALDEAWIDAEPRDGKSGGAFCAPFVGDRSLVLLNWSGSPDSTQTTAHELGHAYHNTTLAGRTALQRQLPMALAETASIFCETLVVEAGLARLDGAERLAQLDVDLVGTNQVIVDIHSRFLFETEVFARRERRTLSASELCEMMTDCAVGGVRRRPRPVDRAPVHVAAQAALLRLALLQLAVHVRPAVRARVVRRVPHGPRAFRAGYDDVLSRAGMDTAEELGAAFGLDVTDTAFWTASLDVVRDRIDDYQRLAAASAN